MKTECSTEVGFRLGQACDWRFAYEDWDAAAQWSQEKEKPWSSLLLFVISPAGCLEIIELLS